MTTYKYNIDENKRIKIRQCKYLNNIVEQDHRFIKRRVRPMLGFKSFRSAHATLAGIELWRMLKKIRARVHCLLGSNFTYLALQDSCAWGIPFVGLSEDSRQNHTYCFGKLPAMDNAHLSRWAQFHCEIREVKRAFASPLSGSIIIGRFAELRLCF